MEYRTEENAIRVNSIENAFHVTADLRDELFTPINDKDETKAGPATFDVGRLLAIVGDRWSCILWSIGYANNLYRAGGCPVD